MSEPAQPSDAPSRSRRLVANLDRTLGAVSGGFLRLEDAALLGWLVLGLPLSRWLTSSNGANAGDPLGSERDVLSGLIWLAATLLAIAVVATRSPGDPVIGFEDMSTRGPMRRCPSWSRWRSSATRRSVASGSRPSP
ncbi:MAG: hypothetical protein ACXWW6_05910 [Candidatus Limnocylindrales bacterium]